jgi:hypothetical protein
MKKLAVHVLVLAVLAALAGLAMNAATPEAEALAPCKCFGPYAPHNATGTGESCSEALSDLYLKLSETYICGVDGACEAGAITITQSCYEYGQPGAWWAVDGQRYARCRVCF